MITFRVSSNNSVLQKPRRCQVAIVIIRFCVAMVLLPLFIWSCGCKPEADAALTSDGRKPISEASSPTAYAAITVPHKESARPSIPPPQFKLFKEDQGMGTVFVVPVATTNEQLISLLWYFRDIVRSRDFSQLGLTRPPDFPAVGSGGLFNVYRGSRCANEAYEVHPVCGNDPHTAAYFQWGLDRDMNRDAGYIQGRSGQDELIFGYRD